MIVKYFAYIRDLTHEKKTNWNKSASDLKELLKQLSDYYGERFRETVFNEDGNDLNKVIIVMVNGIDVTHLDGIYTKLKSDDQISIFPTVAGG